MTAVEVYALDLDEEVLSHLADPESIKILWAERIHADLIEDDFVREALLWQYAHMREHRQPATATVLADQFDLDLQAPETAIGDLLDRLRERYMRNHARSHMEKISAAYKEDPSLVIKVLPQVSRELLQIVGQRGEEYGNGDYDRAIQHYDKMVLSGPGPSFGFKEVDDHFGGVRGVTFGIAPPKTYKSWLYGAHSALENIKMGRTVVFASLELPADETFMRICHLAADVPWWKYTKCRLTPEDRKVLAEAAEILNGLGLFKIIKPESGHRTIEELSDIAMDMEADYLIVDQLQYVETHSGLPLGGCKPQDYWQPLNRARDISDSLPMMIIHQFNRSVMNADQMPEMQQAKGSSSIEEVATLVLGMWANKEMRRSNIVEMGTLASRNQTYEAWNLSVELTRGCDFQMIGKAVHDEDE